MPDDVTIWTDQKFDAPYTDGEIVCSGELANSNGKKAATITLRATVLDPDGENQLVGYDVLYYLEEKVATDTWVVRAASRKFREAREGEQVIEYAPRPVENPGVAEPYDLGGNKVQFVMSREGTLPSAWRLRVMMVDKQDGNPPLSSITISAWARMYDPA